MKKLINKIEFELTEKQIELLKPLLKHSKKLNKEDKKTLKLGNLYENNDGSVVCKMGLVDGLTGLQLVEIARPNFIYFKP